VKRARRQSCPLPPTSGSVLLERQLGLEAKLHFTRPASVACGGGPFLPPACGAPPPPVTLSSRGRHAGPTFRRSPRCHARGRRPQPLAPGPTSRWPHGDVEGGGRPHRPGEEDLIALPGATSTGAASPWGH